MASMPLRPDLYAISSLISPGRRVLDLGCGDGALLDFLVRKKAIEGRGIELIEEHVLACVHRSLSVRHGSLEEGLADYPAASFDTVILSQTLPFVDNPAQILREMLRVGTQAIVSFPNWGYWKCRLELAINGRIPLAPDLPQRWDEAPRWQALTVRDFTLFCQDQSIQVCDRVFLHGEKRLHWQSSANWLATTAIFALEQNSFENEQRARSTPKAP
jgi:methionine biosynthesis protein MetW